MRQMLDLANDPRQCRFAGDRGARRQRLRETPQWVPACVDAGFDDDEGFLEGGRDEVAPRC